MVERDQEMRLKVLGFAWSFEARTTLEPNKALSREDLPTLADQ